MINKLIFSGGGINGLSFLGCLKALEEYNIIPQINILVGSSAGAILSFLINIGYNSEDLIGIIKGINLDIMKDITSNNIFNYFSNFGIDSGNKLLNILKIFIKKKGISEDITFKELYNSKNILLVITGTNLSKGKVDYFEHINYPNMKILTAIRISICIPYIFNKCEYDNCVYVDGSVMSNYPIEYLKNINNTLGFLIKTDNKYENINRLDTFTFSIINCLIKKDFNNILKYYKSVTIILQTKMSLLNYDLTQEQKDLLFEEGYNQTKKYLISNYKYFSKPQNLINEIKLFNFK